MIDDILTKTIFAAAVLCCGAYSVATVVLLVSHVVSW